MRPNRAVQLISCGEPMRIVCLIGCLACVATPTLCSAADSEKPGLLGTGNILMIQVAPDAVHYSDSPEYKGTQWLVGAELQFPSHWLGGYSYFNNSFDQKTQYLYAGYWWKISDKHPNFFFKLTGGALYGYKEPYEDKVPLNHNGLSPAIVPGFGYKFDRFNVQIVPFGSAGIMLTLGYDLIR
jgi:hypothetical protein